MPTPGSTGALGTVWVLPARGPCFGRCCRKQELPVGPQSSAVRTFRMLLSLFCVGYVISKGKAAAVPDV